MTSLNPALPVSDDRNVYGVTRHALGVRPLHEVGIAQHDVLGRAEALHDALPRLQLRRGLEAFVVAEQQHHRHADLDLRQLARARLAERLQDDRRLRIGLRSAQAVLVERGGDQLLELHVAAGVDLRRLQLGKHAGLAANQRDGFVEGRHLLAGELLVEPRAGVERLDLGEREIVGDPGLARLAFEADA